MKKHIILLFAILVSGCTSIPNNKDCSCHKSFSSDISAYKPVDPVPMSKVVIFDPTKNKETEVFWASITDKTKKRNLLPNQSSHIIVEKKELSGAGNYLTTSVSEESGEYTVVMDYMKYRVEQVRHPKTLEYQGSGRVGIGLRITANIKTNVGGLNLGSITGIGLEAKKGNLSGSISVNVIGMDSEGITNLIPMTSEIDQTAILSALQALASVKARLWDDNVIITPHLVAMTDVKKSNESRVRSLATELSSQNKPFKLANGDTLVLESNEGKAKVKLNFFENCKANYTYTYIDKNEESKSGYGSLSEAIGATIINAESLSIEWSCGSENSGWVYPNNNLKASISAE